MEYHYVVSHDHASRRLSRLEEAEATSSVGCIEIGNSILRSLRC